MTWETCRIGGTQRTSLGTPGTDVHRYVLRMSGTMQGKHDTGCCELIEKVQNGLHCLFSAVLEDILCFTVKYYFFFCSSVAMMTGRERLEQMFYACKNFTANFSFTAK